MRKITVIWSSPNRDGLTAWAKDSFLRGMRKTGTEIEEIHLNRQKIGHCLACGSGWGTCLSDGHCVIQDDFQQIYQKMMASDGVVFVSAVYWHDMTECMKAFLDRLRRCETGHNGYLAGKRCFLIACAGGTGRGATQCLHNMEETLSHMEMRAYDRLQVIRFNKDYILPALEQAGEIYARRLEDGFNMGY